MKIEDAYSEAEDGKRQTNDLKCLPDYFHAIARGDKTFEVRRDDRGFQKGDILNLREWTPKSKSLIPEYTGNAEQVLVTYVLTGGQFGIEPGYVVMGIKQFDVE